MNPNITFEVLDEPVLDYTFGGLKAYDHTKVLWKGDWILTIKEFRTTERSASEDHEPKVGILFAVKSNWEWLTYNWGPHFKTLEEAQAEACRAVDKIEKAINAAHQRPKLKQGTS